MSSLLKFQQRPNDRKTVDETIAEQTLALVRTLLASLPEAERQRIARELRNLVGEPDSPKAGDVLASVISLMKKQPEFTVAEVKQHVEERGGASPKEVYNALGYLTRKGRLKRTGYGRYTVDGVEVTTSDDLGGERDRHEDISDDDR